jgi:hypothetical protein
VAADGFRVCAGMRNLASLLITASRSPGFLPAERETLTATAAALWQARTVLQSALDDPEARRRRVFGTPPLQSRVTENAPRLQPETGRAVGMLEASQMLGQSRATLTRRVRESGLGCLVNGEWRIPATALERFRRLP